MIYSIRSNGKIKTVLIQILEKKKTSKRICSYMLNVNVFKDLLVKQTNKKKICICFIHHLYIILSYRDIYNLQ